MLSRRLRAVRKQAQRLSGIVFGYPVLVLAFGLAFAAVGCGPTPALPGNADPTALTPPSADIRSDSSQSVAPGPPREGIPESDADEDGLDRPAAPPTSLGDPNETDDEGDGEPNEPNDDGGEPNEPNDDGGEPNEPNDDGGEPNEPNEGGGEPNEPNGDEVDPNESDCAGPRPAAPSGLHVTSQAESSVSLRWTDNSGNETSFRVARLDDGEDPDVHEHWDNVGVVAANETSFTVTGLVAGARYWFKVRAARDCDFSEYSNVVEVLIGCPVPAAPGGLTVTSVGANSVALAWQDHATNETAYRVARLDPGEDENNPAHWDNVSGDLPANTTSFTAGGLAQNATYRFKVRAENGCGYSPYSNVVSATTQCPVPAAPGGLTVTSVGANSVALAWQDHATNETAYRVARLDPGEDENNPAHWDNVSGDLPANTTSFTAGGLAQNATYRFKVRAENGCGYSPYSNVVSATTQCPVPAAPGGLTVTSVGANSVALAWQDHATNETAYRVARLDPGEDENNPAHWDNVSGDLPANTTSFTAGGLAQNATYRFKVRAENGCGYSPYSNVVSATTQCPVPMPPSNLVLNSVTPTSATLCWQDNSGNELEFRLARLDEGEDPGNFSHWDNVAVVGPNVTCATAGNLCPGRRYWFRVRASGNCGFSEFTNVLEVLVPVPPAPYNCVAARQTSTPQADPILITWDYGGPALSGFRVARLDPGEDENNQAHWDNISGDLSPGARSFVDSHNLVNGQTYRYKVRGFVETACGRVFTAYSNSDPANP